MVSDGDREKLVEAAKISSVIKFLDNLTIGNPEDVKKFMQKGRQQAMRKRKSDAGSNDDDDDEEYVPDSKRRTDPEQGKESEGKKTSK